MIKWGNLEGIDLRLLRRVAEAVQHQQKLSGDAVQEPAFSPGGLLGEHAIAQGMRVMPAAGPLVSHASVGLTFFLLGYTYRCAEAGDTVALSDALDDSNPPGGANDTG